MSEQDRYTHEDGNNKEGEAILEFQKKMKQVFEEITVDPRYTNLLELFRYTYDFKRQIPWLEESEQESWSPEYPMGLPYAIKIALLSHGWIHREEEPEGATPIDDEFRAEFLSASEIITNNLENVKDFVTCLRDDSWILSDIPKSEWEPETESTDNKQNKVGVTEYFCPNLELPNQIDQIMLPHLRNEVAVSLQSYWKRTRSGISGDPW